MAFLPSDVPLGQQRMLSQDDFLSPEIEACLNDAGACSRLKARARCCCFIMFALARSNMRGVYVFECGQSEERAWHEGQRNLCSTPIALDRGLPQGFPIW